MNTHVHARATPYHRASTVTDCNLREHRLLPAGFTAGTSASGAAKCGACIEEQMMSTVTINGIEGDAIACCGCLYGVRSHPMMHTHTHTRTHALTYP